MRRFQIWALSVPVSHTKPTRPPKQEGIHLEQQSECFWPNSQFNFSTKLSKWCQAKSESAAKECWGVFLDEEEFHLSLSHSYLDKDSEKKSLRIAERSGLDDCFWGADSQSQKAVACSMCLCAHSSMLQPVCEETDVQRNRASRVRTMRPIMLEKICLFFLSSPSLSNN